LETLPDFCLVTRDHELLRKTLKDRGYELEVTENAPDHEHGIGRTFTASLERQGENVRETSADERLAVCIAALKAHGCRLEAE
jgi:hypothetical protein